MLILPTSEPERARMLLAQLAADRRHCAIIVFDNSERAREIASRADVRAEGHPFRRVVLIPDPKVLADEPLFAPLRQAREEGAEAVALTLEFKRSSVLSGDDAIDFLALEKAFAAALAGRVGL